MESCTHKTSLIPLLDLSAIMAGKFFVIFVQLAVRYLTKEVVSQNDASSISVSHNYTKYEGHPYLDMGECTSPPVNIHHADYST